jgi:hypothetical protein
MADPTPRSLGELPEPVRSRVVAITADALPDVPKLQIGRAHV